MLFVFPACTTVCGSPSETLCEQREKGQHLLPWEPCTLWAGEAKQIASSLFFYNAEKELCEGFGGLFPSFSVSHSFLIALLQLSVNWPVLPQAAQLTSDHIIYHLS